MKQKNRCRVLGIGSALVDVLARVDDAFLHRIAGEKGGMVMLGADEQEALIAMLPARPEMAPGGAAGNTVFALTALGIEAAMLAKLGKDSAGDFYRDRFAAGGGDVSEILVCDATATGRCVSLITPDSERTMRTHLGASQQLTAAEVAAVDFSRFDLVYAEGYVLFLDGVFQTALDRARQAGCRTAIDLASFEVVRQFRGELRRLIAAGQVDILLANEEEAAELLNRKMSEEAMAMELGKLCPVAAVKFGKRGSLVVFDGCLHSIDPVPVEQPVDSTAAGDFWAAGFLFGLIGGRNPGECGRLASLLGAEAVKVFGSAVPKERWECIKSQL